jgi:hypothetical protein
VTDLYGIDRASQIGLLRVHPHVELRCERLGGSQNPLVKSVARHPKRCRSGLTPPRGLGSPIDRPQRQTPWEPWHPDLPRVEPEAELGHIDRLCATPNPSPITRPSACRSKSDSISALCPTVNVGAIPRAVPDFARPDSTLPPVPAAPTTTSAHLGDHLSPVHDVQISGRTATQQRCSNTGRSADGVRLDERRKTPTFSLLDR